MWAGLYVCPYTKLSPERAMKIIKHYGTDRIMVHNEAPIFTILNYLQISAPGHSIQKYLRKLIDN